MNNPRFYFDHSLLGFAYRRIKEKWFTKPVIIEPVFRPSQVVHYGVKLQVDCLPSPMQDVLMSGNYESSEIRILPGFIDSNDTILEIGAAIGFIGLYCRKVIGVTEMVSVEPNPRTLSYLKVNYSINDLTPCIIEAALAAQDGPIDLRVTDMFWCDSINSRTDTATPTLITVKGMSFLSIVQNSRIRFTTLIVDIEGGEQYLPLDQLPSHVTKILIELHPEVIGPRASFLILENLIRSSGFRIHSNCSNSWALTRT